MARSMEADQWRMWFKSTEDDINLINLISKKIWRNHSARSVDKVCRHNPYTERNLVCLNNTK